MLYNQLRFRRENTLISDAANHGILWKLWFLSARPSHLRSLVRSGTTLHSTDAIQFERGGGGVNLFIGGDGGSAVAAARRLRRWQQRDSSTLVAAWLRRGGSFSVSGGVSSALAQCLMWRQ